METLLSCLCWPEAYRSKIQTEVIILNYNHYGFAKLAANKILAHLDLAKIVS